MYRPRMSRGYLCIKFYSISRVLFCFDYSNATLNRRFSHKICILIENSERRLQKIHSCARTYMHRSLYCVYCGGKRRIRAQWGTFHIENTKLNYRDQEKVSDVAETM
jgi:hypothetical protein